MSKRLLLSLYLPHLTHPIIAREEYLSRHDRIMDTRFWGPSGWKLLHLIAADDSASASHAHADFFETIPYILPCKFCRASLTDYYRKHPYATPDGNMDPALDTEKWMYTIHNCVNEKLRSQDLHPSPAPPFRTVKATYRSLLKCPWQQQLAYFWDFLFSVGYHHPRESRLYSSPMPDCPSTARCSEDSCERNKWNVLPMKDRVHWFRRFWSLLPAVLPGAVGTQWKRVLRAHPPTLSSRASTISWLWAMRCELDRDYRDPYTMVCKRISQYASDCASQRGAFTCRRKRSSSRRGNKTIKNKETVGR